MEDVVSDLEDLRHLLAQAHRENSRRLLTEEIARLQAIKGANDAQHQKITVATPSPDRVYEKKLTEYAWDQSDRYVKFYVTLKDVHTVPAGNIKCSFTENSLTLRVEGLDKKNYVFSILNLLKPIKPTDSKYKVKTDSVVLMAAKREEGVKWSHVTGVEKQAEDARNAKYASAGGEKGDDPAAGIMDLMRKMYNEGDDEMKRTIQKAWTESREKQMQSPNLF